MFKLITIAFAGLLVLACSPQVASNPTPTSTVTPAATTPTSVIGAGACQNTYQTGDTPIVAPRKAGQQLEVALDAVRPGVNGGNRWFVRFYVPAGAPSTAEIPLRATVTGPSGPLQMGAYVAGPANAGFGPLTQPVTLYPCASAPQGTSSLVVVGAESGPVRSGTYTLTWSDIRLPEGGTRTETWTVTLTCEFDPGPGRPQATLCK